MTALTIWTATAHAAVGLFFAISGYHKLFNPERHATMLRTMENLHIPLPRFNAWWVPGNEFFWGTVLAVAAAGELFGVASGLAAVLASVFLGAICLVATCTDGLQRIREWHPLDVADWIDDLMYLPEFWLALVLVSVPVLHADDITAVASLLF